MSASFHSDPFSHLHWLQPQWPAVPGVQAVFTSRQGGCSQAPFDSMNLGDHVGDAAQAVQANRARLAQMLSGSAGQPVQPVFMQQVHGTAVQMLDSGAVHGQPYDACVSRTAGVACTVMVADCLPVLFAHQSGLAVGAAHAGWRGLLGSGAQGVLERTWQAYAQSLGRPANAQLAKETQVWLGPCIGPEAFEVGGEVRAAFVQANVSTSSYFAPQRSVSPSGQHTDKWRANLPGLARQRLQALGLQQIYGNDGSAAWCTVGQPQQYFSHRRDAAVLGSTGRMAACIWLEREHSA